MAARFIIRTCISRRRKSVPRGSPDPRSSPGYGDLGGAIFQLLILASLVLLTGCSKSLALPTPQVTATTAATPAGTGISLHSTAFPYGTASISPADPVVASSWGTWTITYIAGPAGLQPGARLRVELPVFSSDAVFWWPGPVSYTHL